MEKGNVVHDLRKLEIQNAGEILSKLGFSEAKIKSMTRYSL